MRSFLIFVTILIAASALSETNLIQQEWHNFKLEHVKEYNNQVEEAVRFEIFQQNLIKIEEHNKLYEQGLVTYELGVTPFADMTTEEFLAYINSTMPEIATSNEVEVAVEKLPASIDWRQKNVVTNVKNQGACGSCWAFSATGALEGQYALKHHKLVSLSEQNLIDCSGHYGNLGCNGGLMQNAFRYVIHHGITTESKYPYQHKQYKCRYHGPSVLKAIGYINIKTGVNNVRAACAKYGPLSIGIQATGELQHYKRGIINDKKCGPSLINHGVLLVGYGSNYWLVKNSWGKTWGEKGYVRISTTSGKGTGCGITNHASVPQVA